MLNFVSLVILNERLWISFILSSSLTPSLRRRLLASGSLNFLLMKMLRDCLQVIPFVVKKTLVLCWSLSLLNLLCVLSFCFQESGMALMSPRNFVKGNRLPTLWLKFWKDVNLLSPFKRSLIFLIPTAYASLCNKWIFWQ